MENVPGKGGGGDGGTRPDSWSVSGEVFVDLLSVVRCSLRHFPQESRLLVGLEPAQSLGSRSVLSEQSAPNLGLYVRGATQFASDVDIMQLGSFVVDVYAVELVSPKDCCARL